ncbi:MAG TPA: hypothetical protein VGW12_15130 [Pyrinomonadaceae bacterium]|nr:hypothetical protein [Pyrinomonadaceae bacterium]
MIGTRDIEAGTLRREDAAREDSHASATTKLSWRHIALPVVAYVLATWLTDAFYMGDTSFYGAMVANVAAGRDYQLWEATGNYSLWEFGHLLWRPLGVAAFPLLRPLARVSIGADLNPAAVYAMVALNWIAGLASAVLMYLLLRRVCEKEWVVHTTTVAFIFAQAFLNYTQTGCSYVPGLALLMLGLYLLVREADGDDEQAARPVRTATLAGLSFALSVGLWVPYLWAVPAAVCAPLVLYGWRRPRNWRLSIYASLAFGLLTGVLFIGVAVWIGIYTVGGFREWVVASSHHLVQNRGLPQVVFGLARSFISMGSDNVVFKRYLLHDPYSPVSLADLFRLSLWKLALFYLFLAAVALNLSRTSFGRRLLVLLALSGLPVLGFALAWQGTVMERYLPWFPFLFLGIGYALAERRAFRAGKAVVLVFLLAIALTNFAAMWKPALDRREEAASVRVRELQPLVRPESIVLVGKDELENFVRDFPFNPVNHHNDLRVHSFLPLGMPQLTAWREDVARRAFRAWQEGGDVFVSRRVFAARPRAEWEWVEGADPRVRWAEVHEFFAGIETGQVIGGEDGFVLLPRTPENEKFLSQFAAPDGVENKAHDSAAAN